MRCSECTTEFEDKGSAEEKLLQAIFGHQDLCPQCQRVKLGVVVMCRNCGKYAENLVWVNGNPYHPACTPYSD